MLKCIIIEAVWERWEHTLAHGGVPGGTAEVAMSNESGEAERRHLRRRRVPTSEEEVPASSSLKPASITASWACHQCGDTASRGPAGCRRRVGRYRGFSSSLRSRFPGPSYLVVIFWLSRLIT